jgi:ferredoxin
VGDPSCGNFIKVWIKVKEKKVIDFICHACRKCLDVCPNGAIAFLSDSSLKPLPLYAKKSNVRPHSDKDK